MKFLNFCFITLFSLGTTVCAQQNSTELAPWEYGMLDIHHINTGRGDAAFLILPDGTTLLIDAGDMSETHARTLSARNAKLVPNGSKSAPEWIVDYIRQFAPKDKTLQLDYALITHYHDDHFGEMDPNRKLIKEGNYALTGITEVGHHIPIKTLLDRGSHFPIDLKDTEIQKKIDKNDAYGMIPTLQNYWKFISHQTKATGLQHKTFEAGLVNQIALKTQANDFPDFNIRNIAVNGHIWTGRSNETFSLFKKGEYSGENPLSTCLKISYGDFDYFTGGDISGIDAFGGTDITSLESNIAPIVGPVEVATLNHHGNRDSQNSFYVRSLRPRVWIQQNWSSDHPGEEVLRRITSQKLYPGERDIFSTVLLQANKEVIGNRLDQYKSQNGHVVVRVERGGKAYKIFILNDTSEQRELVSEHGPYASE
ncbi:ComEC/Rec2 family competence protein [Zobellia uliginosa]|uniref:ComEC/Rec2 family competence protein n=1 Tax=Zobellia uliginosa TaxID=143224 RepID=UPI0026E320F4|nr:MBL fold metallo-hydrolase [Zobellia uliginosa]MDO6516027.1 MBL fold metallo-hydrolase [Zobellia uliginosa]